jgi:hypothetical protein
MTLRRLVFLFALCLAPLACIAQKPLDNSSIIQMSKAGLGDSLMIESINATPGTYSIAPGDLIALKQAGVSERVIRAVVAKASTTNTVTDPAAGPRPLNASHAAAADSNAADLPPDLSGVDELGIYYKDHNGKWMKMDPEIVNFRSGGALKSYATDHLIKEDNNGHIVGESAPLTLSRSTDFLLYMPVGTDPVEYLLLKLRPGAQHSREFRSQTGGVFHSSSGAVRDQVPFNAVRVAPHVYQFTLPATAPKGEYGILPPGSMNTSNAGSGGKIYTFKIIE